MKKFLFLLALFPLVCYAAWGSFKPYKLENRKWQGEIEVTLIDSQTPGVDCAKFAVETGNPIHAFSYIGAAGCVFSYDEHPKAVVIFPLSDGIGDVKVLLALTDKESAFGHEIRHVFDGEFHNTLLPMIEYKDR